MDVLAKRRAFEDQLALVPANKKPFLQVVKKDRSKLPLGVNRTSHLDAPIMQLSGHGGDINCAKFSGNGEMIASAGFERCIYYWTVYGEQENYAVIRGHSGAILDLQFSSDDYAIYTASTDKTVGMFDVETGGRIKRMKGHQNFVNSVCPARRGPPLVVSGSDDNTVKIWDSRKRGPTHSLQCLYQVTSVSFNDTSDLVFSSGIDNEIRVWDLRKNAVSFKLSGHRDTVTGMELSPEGTLLLSNGMDNTLRVWDVRPFCSGDRLVKTLTGHTHSYEKNLLKCCWSPDSLRVSCGSGDRFVYVWQVQSGILQYKLPGHQGSVNETDFHPKEPILLSASTDRTIFLGEIQPF